MERNDNGFYGNGLLGCVRWLVDGGYVSHFAKIVVAAVITGAVVLLMTK